MKAMTKFQNGQHRGVYRLSNLQIDQMVIMRKHKKDHALDPGWEGPYVFRGFHNEGAQTAILEDHDITTYTSFKSTLTGQEPGTRSKNALAETKSEQKAYALLMVAFYY